MAANASQPAAKQLPDDVQEIVRSVVRRQLHVSLRAGDGSSVNQDGLEIVNDVFLELLKDRSEPILNLQGYAAEVSKTKVKDYFRRTRRVHTSLVDRLRYWLRHVPGYALWKDGNRELCAPAGWTGGRRAKASGEKVASLRMQPMVIPSLPQQDLDLLDNSHWSRLLDAVFNELDGTVEFRDLVAVAACTLRLTEYSEESPAPQDDGDEEGPIFDPPAPTTPSDTLAQVREILRKAWAEILDLPAKQRQAYLLNPTDTEIEAFEQSGTASAIQVADAIGLADGQYLILWRQLPLTAEERTWCYSLADALERFELLKVYLPLEDLVIAKLLSCSRLQVIGLRKCARERLQRRLKAYR